MTEAEMTRKLSIPSVAAPKKDARKFSRRQQAEAISEGNSRSLRDREPKPLIILSASEDKMSFIIIRFFAPFRRVWRLVRLIDFPSLETLQACL